MAKVFCLVKEKADKFLQALKSKEIDLEKLMDPILTSSARRKIFKDVLGVDDIIAKEINTLFESKLLLKYKKRGMINFVQKVAGLKTPSKQDIISKINRMSEVLTPKEEQAFLADITEKRLGLQVTEGETKKIMELAKNAEKTEKKSLQKNLTKEERKQAEIEYGKALIDLGEYTAELKPKNFKAGRLAFNIASLPQSVMTSLDMSAPRQLWGLISTGAFWKNTPKLVSNWFSQASSDKTMAEVMGSPYYKLSQAPSNNKLAISSSITDLSKREDDVMSDFVDKLPILKQSSRSFRGMINATRLSRFKTVYDAAKKNGENVDPKTEEGKKTIEDINKRINVFSARGNIGPGDKYSNISPVLNILFWSARKISADIMMLDPRIYFTGSKAARKSAMKALAGSLVMTVGALVAADKMGYEVQTDPRDTNFGKIKVNNNYVDITGGKVPLIKLIARLGSQIAGKKHKSTTGSFNTPSKLVSRYSRNKLSPVAGSIVDLMSDEELFKGKDFLGREIDLEKLSLENVGSELIGDRKTKDQTPQWAAEKMRPMIISTMMDMIQTGNEDDIIAAMTLFEFFGGGVTTIEDK